MIINKQFTCFNCGHKEIVSAQQEDFESWQNGKYIQDVFSYLSPDVREIMISGFCGKCFDLMFGEEE
jgi:transcription elongation factor Elf1